MVLNIEMIYGHINCSNFLLLLLLEVYIYLYIIVRQYPKHVRHLMILMYAAKYRERTKIHERCTSKWHREEERKKLKVVVCIIFSMLFEVA
jgi:hypothetical protein